MKDNKVNFFNKIKSNKKVQYFLIIILFVVVAIILCFGGFKETKGQPQDQVSSFVSDLESRLSKTLSMISGVGEVDVVINVKSGMETVLAMKTTVTETASGTETVETPILVNGKTVVLKEKFPEITGVLIVAKGANNIAVLTKIQNATMSLLDININKIEILSMK